MRPEKEYLVEEVSRHLEKSDYVFLANYDRITVEEVSNLRDSLAEENAEFHVVKNSILNVAAKSRGLPGLEEWLVGPTAIVIGGDNPSGVAKALKKFFDANKKIEVKVGILDGKTLPPDDVKALAELPSLDVLRAKLLGLLSAPAQRMVIVLNAVPAGLLNVLQAKSQQEN